MKRLILAVALAASCALIAAPALAQNTERAPAAAAPAKPKPKASSGACDELVQGRSCPAAGGRERLSKLEESARRGESWQAGVG